MKWLNACGYVWVVFLVIWLITALQTKPTSRQEDFVGSLGYRILTIIGAFLLFDPRLAVGVLGLRVLPLSSMVAIAGFLLTVLGIGFAVWARFFLGGNWSAMVTVKQNHELVRSGPYAIVRHPIYSGISLAALGTAITLGEVRGFLAVVLMVIGWRWKWGKEEVFMSQQFGQQYADYKRHVNALIPGIW